MLTENAEDIKEKVGIADFDNDGHESVSEYYQKQKAERDSEKDQEKEQKKDKGKDEEETKAIQTVGSVISTVPHWASFALGAGAGGGFGWLLKQLRDSYGKK